MAENTTTLGIEVRVDGASKAGTDLAAVDAAVKKVGASLGSVSKFAGTSGMDKSVADLKALGVNINTSSRHVQNLAVSMQRVARERAFQALASDANLSTMQLARLRAGLGDTRGAFTTLVAGAKSAALGVAAVGAAITATAKICFDAALQADRLSKAYTTIAGSAQGAEKQLAFIRETSNRLGLEFYGTAEAAKTFFAAGKGTSLEKDLNNIFEGVSAAGAALALSQDDLNGIYLALGQMISKGKVQAEELRGQLGERLPGAFQLAAKAMGMTTAELDKAMQKGEVLASDLLPKLGSTLKNEFGDAAVDAADGAQGAVNRLSTAWTDLKANIGDSEALIDMINRVTSGLKSLAEYADLRSVSATFAQGAELAQQGKLDYDAFVKAGFLERQNMVDSVLHPKNEYSGRISHNPPPELLKAGSSDKGPTAKQAEAAAKAIQQVYAEIERLNGTGGEFGYELSAKLQEIARNGKTAGLSLEEINALQSSWSQAAIKKHYDDMAVGLRDVDIEIARMNDDYATLNRLEKERDIEQQRERLLSLGVAQGEVNAKMEEYAAALEKSRSRNTQNLETVNSVLKELEEKTGQYGLSLDSSNRLIEEQARLWRQAGVPTQYIEQLKEIRRLENSTDVADQMRLSWMEFYAEATRTGRQLGSVLGSVVDGVGDAFANFVTTGKLEFKDLANSIIADLARIMTRNWTAQIFNGIGGSGLFSSVVSGIGSLFGFADGAAFATGLEPYVNGVYDRPTYFTMGVPMRFASGGVFGEAGPEAIMPLTRLPGGKLGVESTGGTGNVQVNIYNGSNEKATVRQSTTSNGGKTIEVLIGDVVAKQMNTQGTKLNRTVSSQTGATQATVRR